MSGGSVRRAYPPGLDPYQAARRWVERLEQVREWEQDLMRAVAVLEGPVPTLPGRSPAYTVTTGRAEDWVPTEWEKVQAREAWRGVQERARVDAVRHSCRATLGGMAGLEAEVAGRPLTAVALVMGLGRW